MKESTVRAMIQRACENFGSQKAFAKHLGVSPAWISDVLRGNRRPGKTILDYLGLERVTTYELKK